MTVAWFINATYIVSMNGQNLRANVAHLRYWPCVSGRTEEKSMSAGLRATVSSGNQRNEKQPDIA